MSQHFDLAGSQLRTFLNNLQYIRRRIVHDEVRFIVSVVDDGAVKHMIDVVIVIHHELGEV